MVLFDTRLVGGDNGKSAYQYAIESGYKGSESEFAETLADIGVTLTSTLPSGQTTLTFTDEKITADSVLNAVYTSVFGAYVKSAEFIDGSLTLEFVKQDENMDVKILIDATLASDTDPVNGEDGVGIESIEQTITSEEDDGKNEITVKLTNGENYTFTVQNGSKGSQGEKGEKGTDGNNGKSAYEYAKDGGFEGTEEEFAELLANGNGGTNGEVEIVTSNLRDWVTHDYTIDTTIDFSCPNAIAYGNGMYVAVDGNFNAIGSTDGLNWNIPLLVSDLHTNANDITYGNGVFVAVGNIGYVAVIPNDGTEGIIIFSGVSSGHPLNGVAYGDGRFVAVGDYGNSGYSTDNGNTWTKMEGLSSSIIYNSVAYGKGIFVAVGNDGHYAISTDGTSWTEMTTGDNADLYDVAIGKNINGDVFVFVGENGKVYYTYDGINIKSGFDYYGEKQTEDLYSVVYGNDRFIAVGENGTCRYTTGARRWANVEGLHYSKKYIDVAFADDKFIAISYNNQYSIYTAEFEKITMTLEDFIQQVNINDVMITVDLSDKADIDHTHDDRYCTKEELIDLSDDVDTVEAIAKGRNQALSYNSYSEMITVLNNMSADELNRGQNIYIATLGVPDLWVYGVEETNVEYTYVDDDTFVEGLNVNTSVQVGHYRLAQLETQKVDVGGITNDINALEDTVEVLENTLGYTVGKNLLEVTAINRTIGGITFTFNADKSVTANGTASSIGLCPVNPLFRLPNGEYILSGCPEGGSESSYRLDIVKYNDSSDRIAIDIGQGATFTIDSEDPMILRAYINRGTTVDNLTFYPMIRKADITDDTYVPYKDDVDTRLNNTMDKVNPTFSGNLTRNPSQVYTNTVDLRTSCDWVDLRPYDVSVGRMNSFINTVLSQYDTNNSLKPYTDTNNQTYGTSYPNRVVGMCIGDYTSSNLSNIRKIFTNNLTNILNQLSNKRVSLASSNASAYYEFDLNYYKNTSVNTYVYTASDYVYMYIALKLVSSTSTSFSARLVESSVYEQGELTLESVSNTFMHGRDHLCSGGNNVIFGISNFGQGNQMVIGHYNNFKNSLAGVTSGTSTGSAFCIGNGTTSAGANALRVTYGGRVYAQNSALGTGADYSEYFEWLDGNEENEDRVGYFVTFDEKQKIRKANATDDYILGIVSGLPCIIGNGDECWRGRYILDEFGRFIEETFEYEETVINSETGEEETVTRIGTKYKENPEYNPNQPYEERAKRKEWSAIGMIGVLSVRDDGTCQENGYCTVADGGIATACEYSNVKAYRVLERVTDNIVKVLFR